ncbi:MAG: DUF937 domain-containing protein [Nevskiaceae bacterium]|nr:MAG: DUF937 domain-containing protein [Nevskiaceae bacterium]TBR75016.1 MAG: DUF937 domain-containing protein [Nevskiaceae bacterium]
MGLLDGVIQNAVQGALGGNRSNDGSNLLNLAMQLVQSNGGLQGLLNRFTQSGFGEHVQSWVGSGANLPINADAITKVLGSSAVAGLAQKLGSNPQETAQTLSGLLPQLVNHLTPNGEVPADSSNLLTAGLGALGSLLGNK